MSPEAPRRYDIRTRCSSSSPCKSQRRSETVVSPNSTSFRSIFTPMVAWYFSENIDSTKRLTRLVFPTDVAPSMQIFRWTTGMGRPDGRRETGDGREKLLLLEGDAEVDLALRAVDEARIGGCDQPSRVGAACNEGGPHASGAGLAEDGVGGFGSHAVGRADEFDRRQVTAARRVGEEGADAGGERID